MEDKSQDTELHRQSGITFLEGGLTHKMEKKSGITDTIFISVHKPDSAHIILESPTNTANIRIGQLFFQTGVLMVHSEKSWNIDLQTQANIILRLVRILWLVIIITELIRCEL
ncbi:hypothetical protein [Sphingobacterium sp. IITKGP-BTPF85]|uniref:hypothetical protein n=1 Tax=Sphingobacterium sp. IITKGP-BTPF85 TaxID=1338009 RepID=UPI000402E198|nr:hypothetical protein [Sphingobacterium sp. IITKGP-BTPF85]